MEEGSGEQCDPGARPSTSSGISFTFQKKSVGARVRREGGSEEREEEKDFVISLEGKEIQRCVL